MPQSEVRIAWEQLHEFTKKVFVQAGLPSKDAENEADVLVWANRRGADSHGVLRIHFYLENIDKGLMNPKPNIRVTKETAATLLIDADRALGPIVTIFAMNRAIEKAREVGICWAIIRNLTHQGALGYYSLMAAEKDMAGIVFVCGLPNMAPYGARVAGVHNSPISISVPAKRHPPLILDMANSVVARGKIRLAIDKGIPIPEGWALDKDGNPTTQLTNIGALLPIAGPKGSGLALMFECLSSVMVDNPLLETELLSKNIEPVSQRKKQRVKRVRPGYATPYTQNGVVAAIDISKFTNVESYKEHIDSLIDGLKALPKAGGFSEILVPGELKDRTDQERSRNGIPLPEGTIRNIQSVAERYNVKLPPCL